MEGVAKGEILEPGFALLSLYLSHHHQCSHEVGLEKNICLHSETQRFRICFA